jgi:hypothetical protein
VGFFLALMPKNMEYGIAIIPAVIPNSTKSLSLSFLAFSYGVSMSGYLLISSAIKTSLYCGVLVG